MLTRGVAVTKLTNLLRIVSLLQNRSSLSVETTRKECGISSRTVYRYIDQISSSGFPVWYDPDLGGYRMHSSKNVLASLSATEAAILLIGLLFVEESLADEMIETVNLLREKLESKLSIDKQELLASCFINLVPSHIPEGLKKRILIALARLAQSFDRVIEVIYIDEEQKRQTRVLRSPRLAFDRGWKLTAAQSVQAPIDIASVLDLRNFEM